jgi:hypothetical protein
VSAQGGEEMADLKFDKEITALLIIDPYNDFIPPWLWRPCCEFAGKWALRVRWTQLDTYPILESD